MSCDSGCNSSDNTVMRFAWLLQLAIGIVAVCSIFPERLWARKPANLPHRPFLFYTSANIALTSTAADKVSGASYTKNMRSPIVGAAGLGAFVKPWFWIGARYENWFANREFSLAGNEQRDRLHLQQLGPEIGYVRGNPRVSYLFSVGALYPFEQRIMSSTQGTFSRGTRFWNYIARASMELRLNSRFDFHLEAGYRWVNLRDLQSQGTSFLSGGADLNLSGPFTGVGLGFRF